MHFDTGKVQLVIGVYSSVHWTAPESAIPSHVDGTLINPTSVSEQNVGVMQFTLKRHTSVAHSCTTHSYVLPTVHGYQHLTDQKSEPSSVE